MKFLLHVLSLTLLMLSVTAFHVDAQQGMESDHDHRHGHDIYRHIEQAYQEGKLTLDQKVLLKFYAGHNSQKLPSEYQNKSLTPAKCGTPAYSDFHRNKEHLSRSTVSEIESAMDTQTSASETHTSPSGRFNIHYDTSGEHAVPSKDSDNDGTPDYVDYVAAAADSSYRHQVQNLGYTNPIPQGQTYDIFIRNLEFYYGETYTFSGTTRIRIENDFSEGFPTNDHPDGDQVGAINVTVAHEFKHAVQYEANNWGGETGNWLEMDATLLEEVVYDNVNDYYNYIESVQSIFNNPQISFYPGSYFHITWALFFEEKYGPNFWPQVWQLIKNNPSITMVEAITQQLGSPDSFRHAFSESQLWHYASGPQNSLTNYGFEESENYPDPTISATIDGTQDSLNNSRSISPFAAAYFQILPRGNEQNQIQLTLNNADTTIYAAGTIAYFKDGTTDTFFGRSNFGRSNHELILKTPWSWDEVEKVGVVATNFNHEANSLNLNISVSSYRAKFVELDQNYPNPFNSSTKIKFRLLTESNVQLRIYDITGRLVQTVLDKTLPAGTHKHTFSANGLASGVYIYQLLTKKQTVAQKMTLIK